VKAADANDGSQIWSHSRHTNVVYTLDVSNGVVYSGGDYDDQTVKATDASDGSKVWSHNLHSGGVKAVDEMDGVVYSGTRTTNTVRAAEINGITFRPADGGTGAPQVYHNGEWLVNTPVQGSTGGSY
jgi:outer membrane protein assembly factor BamB